MTTKLHVLIVEDLPSDAELAKYEINKVLENYLTQVVETEDDFRKALESFKPDLIISDYKLPSFDGLSALKIAQEKSPFTPFVILTGSMNEDTAVKCMKAGADDYVIKEHIKRLGPAILNAMKKKQIEFERAQQEKEYRQLIDGMNDTAFVINFEGKFVEVNETAVRVLGYSRDELLTMGPTDIDPHLTAEDIGKMIREIESGSAKKQVFETEHRTKTGKIIPVEISSSPITYKREFVILSIARDITERKRIEEKLKDSEIKYRGLFENSSEFLFTLDLKGNFTDVNKAAENLTGYTKAELLKMNFKNYTKKEDYRRLFIAFNNIYKTGKPLHNLFIEANMKDKSKRYFQISLNLLRKGKEIIGYQGSSMDITERKLAEETLKRSEEFNRAIIENSKDCIKLLDLDGNLLYMSPGGQELLEIDDIGKYLNKSWIEFWKGEDYENAKCSINQGKEGGTGYFEGYCSTEKGTPKWWSVIISPILDEHGKVDKILSISRDITERKQAEEQIKKELLENKVLLREVHHRTKNNLQTINSLLQLQQDTIKTKEDAFKSFEVSQDRIRTMAQAYEILLASEYMSEVKLGEYLTLLAGQLKRNYDAYNKVKITFSLEEVHFETEKLSKLGLIVNEILTNAMKYAFQGKDKGNIHIELNDMKDHLVIKISDDGIGIPENIDVHKPETLGLSLVGMLLEEFNGSFSVERKKGTSFTLEIPKERINQ